MEAFLDANETIMKSMAALNAEMMAFGNRRICENLERGESLADCEGAEAAFKIHSEFFQTATQQYLEQTSTVLALMAKMTEELWSPLRLQDDPPAQGDRRKRG